MLWLFIMAAVAGLLLGLALLRVLAVLAASIALVVTAVVWMTRGQWGLLDTIVYTLLLLASLQCSYLLGFIFSIRWTRVASPKCSRIPGSG